MKDPFFPPSGLKGCFFSPAMRLRLDDSCSALPTQHVSSLSWSFLGLFVVSGGSSFPLDSLRSIRPSSNARKALRVVPSFDHLIHTPASFSNRACRKIYPLTLQQRACSRPVVIDTLSLSPFFSPSFRETTCVAESFGTTVLPKRVFRAVAFTRRLPGISSPTKPPCSNQQFTSPKAPG